MCVLAATEFIKLLDIGDGATSTSLLGGTASVLYEPDWRI